MVEGREIGCSLHAASRPPRGDAAIDAPPLVTGKDIVEKPDALICFHAEKSAPLWAIFRVEPEGKRCGCSCRRKERTHGRHPSRKPEPFSGRSWLAPDGGPVHRCIEHRGDGQGRRSHPRRHGVQPRSQAPCRGTSRAAPIPHGTSGGGIGWVTGFSSSGGCSGMGDGVLGGIGGTGVSGGMGMVGAGSVGGGLG